MTHMSRMVTMTAPMTVVWLALVRAAEHTAGHGPVCPHFARTAERAEAAALTLAANALGLPGVVVSEVDL